MSAGKSKKKKKKRLQRRLMTLLVVLFIAVGVILSMTVFFEITEVRVEGELSHYNAQQITAASGISTGKNLFRFSASECEQAIWSDLPYIEEVKIRRSLPGTVTIEIVEAKGILLLDYSGAYLVVSDELKILEVAALPLEDAILVSGVVPDNPSPGSMLAVHNTENVEFLKILVVQLESQGLLDNVTAINVADKLNYSLVFENRLSVMIGTANNLEYKLQMFVEVVENKLSDSDMGYVDLSIAGKATFRHGDIHAPEQSEESTEDETDAPDVATDPADGGTLGEDGDGA